jgi:cytochrome c-type biogenesis protein CcmH
MRALAVGAVVFLALQASASACVTPKASQASLEGQVMCPVCKTTLDQSDSLTATQIKRHIAARICAGATAGQIKSELAAEFGSSILAAPPRKGFDLLAWWLPIVGILVAAAAIAGAAWQWSRRSGEEDDGEAETPLDPELERRVDDALRGFEA